MAGWRSMSSSVEMTSFFVRSSSRQSCARAGRGASLRRSHFVSTSLRYSLSRLHRGTRCVRFALYARTTAMNRMTKRAARAAVKSPLLGVAEAHRDPPERSFAEGLLVCAATNTNHATSSRQAVPGGGDFCGGEEASPGHKQSIGLFVPGEQQGLWPGAAGKAISWVGARSALRKHAHRGCPNEVNAVNVVSSAMRPKSELSGGGYAKRDRHSMSPRPVLAAATRALTQAVASAN